MNTRNSSSRTLWIAAAVIAVLVAVIGGLIAVDRRPAPIPSPQPAPPADAGKGSTISEKEPGGEGPRISAENASPVEATLTGPEPTTSVPLRLRATLRPPGGSEPFQAWGIVGIAKIDPQDRREFELQRQSGGGGAGPTRVEELANVAEWIQADVTPDSVGGGVLGPVEVKPADVYRVVAWDANATWYMGEFVPPAEPPADGLYDAGDLDPVSPTGIRLTITNNSLGEPGYLIRLARAPNPRTAERDSAMLPVIEWVSPELADALDGEHPLVVSPAKPAEFLPLYPDRAIRLLPSTLSGTDGLPLYVELRVGEILDVELDISKTFSAESGGFLDLNGRLVWASDRSPVEGARIERVDAPIESVQVTDSDGAFLFPDLSRMDVSRFRARVDVPDEGRPRSPAEHLFSVNPLTKNPQPQDTEISVEWEYPVYRWLVLDWPRAKRVTFKDRRWPYYPVYVLQKPSSSRAVDPMETANADHFIEEDDGVAVSINQPGTYRIVAVVSPVCAAMTDTVEFGKEDTEIHVTADVDSVAVGPGLTLVCLDKGTGGGNGGNDGANRGANGGSRGNEGQSGGNDGGSGVSNRRIGENDGGIGAGPSQGSSRPLAFTQVEIHSGLARGVPPVVLETDSQGRIPLGPVTAKSLTLTAPGPTPDSPRRQAKAETDKAVGGELRVYF